VGVPIFFVISGLVIALVADGQSAGQFVRKRATRLYLSAWLCATATALIAGASLDQYIRSVTLFPIGPWVDGVYWTLAIEIAFYGLVTLAIAVKIPLASLALGLGAYSTAFWTAKAVNSVAGGPLDSLFSAVENNEGYLLLAHDGIFFAIGMLVWAKQRSSVLAMFGAVGFFAILVRSHAITPYGCRALFPASAHLAHRNFTGHCIGSSC
jgi:peptidoglycan/LPS O-acetylase OafA/YrhL